MNESEIAKNIVKSNNKGSIKASFFNTVKKFSLWFVVILYLEIVFAIIMKNKLSFDSLINILIFNIITSSFLSIVINIFKSKINKIVTAITILILCILYITQVVFYDIFKVYFSTTNLGLGDQAFSFMGRMFKALWQNVFSIIILLVPFVLYLFFKKKLKFKHNNKYEYGIFTIILILFVIIFNIKINITKGKTNGLYDLYHNVNEVSLNINKLGVLNSYYLDVKRLILGFEPKHINYVDEDAINGNNKKNKKDEIVYKPNTLNLDFDKSTNNSSITKINNYVKEDSGTKQNEYTGKYKGYNLIYITAESFSEIGVSEEYTPTLYKLTHSGLIFDNYYTPNVLSTIGGEFQSVTGLYPDSSILSKWRSGTNLFPYGLGTIFKAQGYDTHAYHNNSYKFQDRHQYLKSQGFDNFLACYNGLEKRIACGHWPQSDIEMINTTVDDYINSDKPFLAYYMTVSGHFNYTWSGNYIASKNKSLVSNLDKSEAAKAYVATQIELDKALELLLNKLEEAGKLDNTIIVLLADHYPYELDLNSINSLSSYERDSIVGVNKNNLIIWNNQMEDKHIDKVCMSVDVLPTVYNLFGIEYDSRLYTGRDILSDSLGIAIMRNHSWVTDKGTYYASSGKFEGSNDLPDGYIDNINTLVNNRLNIAKLIISTDYYRYLFDK